MNKTLASVKVKYENSVKDVELANNLENFIKNVKKAFKFLREPFSIVYKIENKKAQIEDDLDYESITDKFGLVLQILPPNAKKPISSGSQRKKIVPALACGDLTPTGSRVFLSIEEERKGTGLEIIAEGNSVLCSDEDLDGKMDINLEHKVREVERLTRPCIVCKGNKISASRLPCKECDGTGLINAYLCEYIEELVKSAKKMKQETVISILNSKVNQLKADNKAQAITIRNLLDELLGKADTKAMLSSVYKGQRSDCSKCKTKIEKGEVVFMCRFCTDVFVCESCEEETEHDHALFKQRIEGKAIYYKAEICPEIITAKVERSDSEITCPLTIVNIGKRAFPDDTVLRLVDEEAKKESMIKIGKVKPGTKRDMMFKWKFPKELREVYRFQLASKGDFFGKDIVLKISCQDNRNDTEEEARRLISLGLLPREMEKNFILLYDVTGGGDPMRLIEVLKKSNNNVAAAGSMLY